jgi:hypothetical protein
MAQLQPLGRNSQPFCNPRQGRIIDPNEKFDPRTDPRSAVPPAIRDGLGSCSESLTRGFLKDKICACWDLTGISMLFPLMHCYRTHHKVILFRTTFSNLSIANCTILWRAAQKFSMQEATTEVGNALKKVYASSRSRNQERSWVEDKAFRILVRSPCFFWLRASTNLLHQFLRYFAV